MSAAFEPPHAESHFRVNDRVALLPVHGIATSTSMSAPAISPFVPHDIEAPIAGRDRGELKGLTFAVKDMIDVSGERRSGGSPAWHADESPAPSHAPVVSALLDAGATLIGKTVCDELFYSLTGANAHYGTPWNPRWPGCLPGGSSSGSASAVASGCCDFAIGSDTAGSVRIPAALCGVFGIRSTAGAVDSNGVMNMAPSFDSLGWFAASPGVLRSVGEVLPAPTAAGTTPVARVLVPVEMRERVEPEVRAVLDRLVERLPSSLPRAERSEFLPIDPADCVEQFRVAQAWEFATVFGDFLRHREPALGPGIAERVHFALSIDDALGHAALSELQHLRARLHHIVTPGVVVVMPTSPCRPPRRDASTDELQTFRAGAMPLTMPASVAGLPQLAMPAHGEHGPMSVSLLGARHTDRQLLDLAVELAPILAPSRATDLAPVSIGISP
jgi:amidase